MIEAHNIVKTFTEGVPITVLKGINLVIKTGEFVSIIGPSGAGKSTLLYQLSLLDQFTSGKIIIDDINVETLSDDERINFRLNYLGFIFQDHALLPELTAIENVAVPLLMLGMSKKEAYSKALQALAKLGLDQRKNNLPSQLSGGEKQRVSIARAIVNKPKILFADEPTASLDSERSLDVMEALLQLNQEGQTIVMVTHESEYAQMTHRIVKIADGQVVDDILVPHKK
ncbi:MAG: ABC transporter ATP-binding protein [Patescibacteria group bacterium]